MNGPNVKFALGSSTNFPSLLKDPSTLYFLQDTHEVYLGDTRYALGDDIAVIVSGEGEFIMNVEFDSSARTLTFTRGDFTDATSLVNFITEQVAGGLAESIAYTNEAVSNLILEAGDQVRWRIEDGIRDDRRI